MSAADSRGLMMEGSAVWEVNTTHLMFLKSEASAYQKLRTANKFNKPIDCISYIHIERLKGLSLEQTQWKIKKSFVDDNEFSPTVQALNCLRHYCQPDGSTQSDKSSRVVWALTSFSRMIKGRLFLFLPRLQASSCFCEDFYRFSVFHFVLQVFSSNATKFKNF